MNERGEESVDVLISFGSNLGDRQQCFATALRRLQDMPGVDSVVASQCVVTRSVGGPADQPDFLNAAIRARTSLSPAAFHQHLIQIESELGRERRIRWGSRNIDLDLLLYADRDVVDDHLLVPHPRMSFRRFVLEPANEIAGDMIHPTSGLTIRQLLDHLDTAPNVISIVRPETVASIWDGIVTAVSNANPAESNWQFVCRVPGMSSSSKTKSKLVVFDSTELPFREQQRTRRFRGPTLGLQGLSIDSKVHEIIAALSAMEPNLG